MTTCFLCDRIEIKPERNKQIVSRETQTKTKTQGVKTMKIKDLIKLLADKKPTALINALTLLDEFTPKNSFDEDLKSGLIAEIQNALN